MGLRRISVKDINDYETRVVGDEVLLTLKSAQTVIRIPVAVIGHMNDTLARSFITWGTRQDWDDAKINYSLLDSAPD